MSHWKKLLKKCASVQGGDIERKMELDSLIKNRNRLRRIFCEKLDAIEVAVAEVSAQDSFMRQLMELIRERVHDPNLSLSLIHI